MSQTIWIKRVSFNNHPIILNQSSDSDSVTSDSKYKPIEIFVSYTLEPHTLPDDFYDRIDQTNEKIFKQKEKIKSASLFKEVEVRENQLKEKLFEKLAGYLSKRNQTKKLINQLESNLNELNSFIVSLLT